MKTDELILYRNCINQDILTEMVEISEKVAIWESKKTAAEKTSYIAGISSEILPLANGLLNKLVTLSADYGFEGNLWHTYLTLLLVMDENVYTLGTEIRGDIGGSLSRLAMHDIRIFMELFSFDIRKIDLMFNISVFNIAYNYDRGYAYGHQLSRRIRDRIIKLSNDLSDCKNENDFFDYLIDFYKVYGVGMFGLNEAFRIAYDENGNPVIKPVLQPVHVRLSDLVGYEIQKKKLKENTEAFIKGKSANNCLLYGDAGTGKSTSIKAIANKYYRDGLRIIELYKHQFDALSLILSQIKGRHYKFIIFMDDLSFEENETEYKYLKAIIEGGLEKKPDNVLIYATSNRRHLIRETFRDKQDRDEELHTNDTVQEKLSLSARFGVTIYFGKPEKKEFDNIIKVLSKRNGIKMNEEELLLEANKWELSHGGMSGRTASQFIDHINPKSKKA